MPHLPGLAAHAGGADLRASLLLGLPALPLRLLPLPSHRCSTGLLNEHHASGHIWTRLCTVLGLIWHCTTLSAFHRR